MTESTTTDPDELPDRPRSADTWYDVLDIARDADAAAVLVAYERALRLIDGRNLGSYFLLDPKATAVARQDIEAAYAILSDDDRRSAYDRSLFGDDTDGPSGSVPVAGPAKTIPPASAPPSTPSTPPSTTSTPPTTSTSPRPTLRFLAPVDDGPVAPADDRVARRLGGIAFAIPKTDIGEESGAVASATVVVTTPPTPPPDQRQGRSPALVATATVLPTAAMPSPHGGTFGTHEGAFGANEPRPIAVPQTATPTPPPGLFAIDGEVNGQTLRRLREARKLTIDELADATKIRKPYLAAIEEQDLENLPSRVYLRGFLTQIARVLRVDKTKLADGYLAFIARFGR